MSWPYISILHYIDFIWERIYLFKILTAFIINLIILVLNLVFKKTFLFNMRPSLLSEHWIRIHIILSLESHNLMIFRCCFISIKFCILYLFILLYVDCFIFILNVVSVFLCDLLDHCNAWVVQILDLLVFIRLFDFKITVLSWDIWREKHFNFVAWNYAIWCNKLLVLNVGLSEFHLLVRFVFV